MPIYESKGFGNDLNLFDKKAPFDYIAEFRPITVPKGVKLTILSAIQPLLYCWHGETRREWQLQAQ